MKQDNPHRYAQSPLSEVSLDSIKWTPLTITGMDVPQQTLKLEPMARDKLPHSWVCTWRTQVNIPQGHSSYIARFTAVLATATEIRNMGRGPATHEQIGKCGPQAQGNFIPLHGEIKKEAQNGKKNEREEKRAKECSVTSRGKALFGGGRSGWLGTVRV